MKTLALLGIVLAVLAGCSTPPPLDLGNIRPRLETGLPCTTYDTPQATPGPEALPAGFTAVLANRCLLKPVSYPGDGDWLVKQEEKATSGLDKLLTALRLPSKEHEPNQACDASLPAPIVIILTGAEGKTLRPNIPHDGCNDPLVGVLEAIAALPWQVVSTVKFRQTRSESSITTGCSDRFKQVIDLENGQAAATAAPLPSTVKSMQICRYENGKLTTTGELKGDALTRFTMAYNGSKPAGSCAASAAPFAVVSTADSHDTIVAELGGCHRALDLNQRGLRQLDATTVALLG